MWIVALFLALFAIPSWAIDIGAMPNPSYYDPNAAAAKVEGQFSYSGSKVADYQVKASPGLVHALNCMGDGSALAGGTVILYDSLTESGAIIWQGDFIITGDYRAFTVPLNNIATIGLYLGFTTVTDIRCSVSFR